MKHRTFDLSVSTCLICLLFFSFPAVAQIENPVLWDSFVGDPLQNISLRDTFLFQSFEGSPVDSWNYDAPKGILRDVSQDGITGQGGSYSLKLSSNTTVFFEKFDPAIYKKILVYIAYAGYSLPKNSALSFDFQRGTGNQSEHIECFRTTGKSTTFSYRTKINPSRSNPLVLGDVYSLGITTSGLFDDDAYICLDSVFVRGEIVSYSLFTGKGNWQDTACWSHLPPERRRNALVKGDVTVNTSIACNDLSVSDGSLHIADNCRLNLNNLALHETNAWFSSEGSAQIDGQITVYRTFEQKGKWYFISFPFDVYQDGIDSAFELKDDTPNDGGNYFYVLTYNGEKRQTTNKPFGNWDVFSPVEGRAVFEKNRGYLIALDEKAGKQTLSFASSREIAAGFGQTGVISIPVSSAEPDNENSGWNLCGNPFAAPLSLSGFPDHPDLDGHVYMYDGVVYRAYKIGGKYKIPPFSAFFVKAKASMELTVTHAFGAKNETLLAASAPVRLDSHPNVEGTVLPETGNKVESMVKGSVFSIRDLPSEAILSVYKINGKIVSKKHLPAGSSEIPLSLSRGFYIVRVESPVYQAQHKCVINE